MHFLQQCLLTMVVGAVYALTGCSSRSEMLNMATVSGRVLLDGLPLEQGRVQFVPVGAGQPAIGIIKAGYFVMRTSRSQPGVVKDSYQVSIISTEPLPEVPLNDKGLPEIVAEPESSIPRRYNSGETSGLTVDVTGPMRELVFELTSE
jgi:hypothetical protein